jgi:hypothetical protein
MEIVLYLWNCVHETEITPRFAQHSRNPRYGAKSLPCGILPSGKPLLRALDKLFGDMIDCFALVF